MNKGCRLRAKGEKIKFETEDGEKEYLLKPLKNKELLEITEIGQESKVEKDKGNLKQATKLANKSGVLLIKYTLNRDPKIVNGTEEPFTDEEINEMETNYLTEILEIATKLNKLEDTMDFRLKEGRQKPDLNQSSQTKSEQDTSQVKGRVTLQ